MTYLIEKNHQTHLKNWNEVRELLLGSSQDATISREQTASRTSTMKKICSFVEILAVSGAMLTLALVRSRSLKLLAIPHLTLAFGFNELRNVAQNMEQLLNADVSVRKDASSPEQFLRTIYKGTLLIEYYFKALGEPYHLNSIL